MNVQEQMNQKYEKLCAVLGDLTCKSEAIASRIQEVKEQIRALDAAVPEMKKLEEAMKAASENVQD